MTAYIIRRLLMSIPILVGISILSFMIMFVAPGDPASLQLDPSIKPEDRERVKEALGLNDPLHNQYIRWMGNILQGDFGTSFIRKVPVSELIVNRFPNTFLLMCVSFVVAVLISIPLGVISATKQYSKRDYAITFTSFVGLATPNFWLGLLLIMYLSVRFGWFPTGGVATLGAEFSLWDRVHHLVLPAFVLASADMASLVRYTRSSMLEVIRQDYIRTARAKGFKETKVVYKHGLRNGLLPIITIFGLTLPTFLGGAVIVEQLFSWPGLGKLFIDSVFQRDYPVVMGLTMISAVFVVIGNLIADILYAVIDPRIEY